MDSASANIVPGVPKPWWEFENGRRGSVAEQLACDQLAVGVVHLRHPQADEILLVRGWADADIQAWSRGGFEHDPLFQTAKRRGVATASGEKLAGSGALISRGHAMTCLVPESLGKRRWWWMQVARESRPFSLIDRQVANLILRQWQARFNLVGEPGMGRLLLGHDNRLIHADPFCQTMLLRQKGVFRHFIESLLAVASQRWPNMPLRDGHDFVIELAGASYWVCFYRGSALRDDPSAAFWYVELRPLEKGELAPVGAVDDPRVAEALAYLHDNFHLSPNLSAVADAVRISPFHFHRLFSRTVGVSPKQYLQGKQLQVAKWLLRSSRIPIGAIAQQAGFSSHGHFTSTFHRLTGLSPSEYREKE